MTVHVAVSFTRGACCWQCCGMLHRAAAALKVVAMQNHNFTRAIGECVRQMRSVAGARPVIGRCWDVLEHTRMRCQG